VTFSIAIGSPDYPYSPAEVSRLLNDLGVQCVPLDVVGLGISSNHLPTMNVGNATNLLRSSGNSALKTLEPMYNMLPASAESKSQDILSFWTYTGWSMKKIDGGTQGFKDYKEGFEEAAPVAKATAIPGFIIPKPVAPKQPSPKMNSNGGLVTIS
jgi:hypothetical protein